MKRPSGRFLFEMASDFFRLSKYSIMNNSTLRLRNTPPGVMTAGYKKGNPKNGGDD
tara:strand:+ start:267 stop:434 length:168 start_codon:yes stop_codon:yes gene_type:complete